MEPQINFDMSQIHNLEKILDEQVFKFHQIRSLVRDLEFKAVDPIGTYSSVTYKSIDGGKMGISFYPFELDYIVIADSFGNDLIRFLVPKGEDLDANDFKYLDDIKEIKKFTSLLGVDSILYVSDFLKNSNIAMEIAEYASIFYKLTQNKNEPVLVMKDGLLRTKALKKECISSLLRVLQDYNRRKLIGVAKSSKVLNLISSALFIENKIPKDKTGYIEIPWEIEREAYKQIRAGRLYQAFGKMYIAKLSKMSNLLVTIEIPYNHLDGIPIYTKKEINEMFGHLIKDSMGSYPILGYPQTIMRAHEKAVRTGFTASIWRDKIIGSVLKKIGKPELNRLIIEGNVLRDYVKKGLLGGI